MNAMTQPSPNPETEPDIQPAMRTGAQLVVDTLAALGVECVFGYPGGAIMPVYDAIAHGKTRHILVRHEQAAAFAADSYGRITGRAGVCLATSGPGATNLITGIANAYLDSVPMVAITGQVAQPMMGTDAFQETDIFGMTMPIVKHSVIVRRPEDIPSALAEAFAIAEGGRPGPVLVDLPKDVQQASCEAPGRGRSEPEVFPAPCADAIATAEEMIASAKRPLFYLGGGIARANASEMVRRIVEESGIPAVATLQGLGVLAPENPAMLGMLGMHGHRAANMAVQESDLLIVLGARFDDRATGKLAEFAPHARVVHIDTDAAEFGKLRIAHAAVCGSLKGSLGAIDFARGDIDEWTVACAKSKAQHAPRYDAPGNGVYAPALLKSLSERVGDSFVAACDVGQHQMWVAQHCRFSRPQAHLTSGGLGAMGYGLPAAIGAKLAEPESDVFAICGDGGFQMNIQELATLRRYQIPVKIVLLDNAMLGLVRQWQELFFAGNYSEVDLSDNPDFVEVANAFGIEAFSIERREEVDGAIDRLIAARGPILAHVRIDPEENVWPLVPPGASNAEMMEKKP
ncbi:acetolactate synthase 2 catalytic subunit [Alteriqipengyuania lutimaris]|uniref:Acetolactate synthase n=1 Tax=Alteriqipengyuania lutimaris TaxID=1538146 RepID=A0A395LH71_9SPHN|nr:acetolactate synthase 2 catalytic subunit [Alteriqipengyuania lutimaris]MBB3034912.1 acetolactate synthase-1/2/3 large subunit [Alteriqipengyuania lutimaris]RDS76258.1 acetolactate synthase 2 catalytic subunit [Alteriqipengyuania lutimaris]